MELVDQTHWHETESSILGCPDVVRDKLLLLILTIIVQLDHAISIELDGGHHLITHLVLSTFMISVRCLRSTLHINKVCHQWRRRCSQILLRRDKSIFHIAMQVIIIIISLIDSCRHHTFVRHLVFKGTTVALVSNQNIVIGKRRMNIG